MENMRKYLGGISLVLCCLLWGCADLAPRPGNGASTAKASADFSLSAWSDFLEKMSGREPGQLRQEAQRLAARTPGSPAERLKLAWLLDQEGATEAELARSHELLTGLDDGFSAPALGEYVRLKRRAVGLALQLRKERQQVEELQAKIERLKNLEQNLLDGAKPVPATKK